MSDTATSHWSASSAEAAERSLLSGETQTAIAQLVTAWHVAVCLGERVPKGRADQIKHKLLVAAGIESPENAA